jgi:phenylacetic acid degradation operon negative regulatory protein
MALDGSARAALLTVFGDVVRPAGGRAWLGSVSNLMDELGVSPSTTRQALRRLTLQGMVDAQRHGRRSVYAITPTGAARLDEAAQRIYRRAPRPWDGQWRLLTWTFEEEHRSARDALRRELGWLGYGSLGTSSYCCPWDSDGLSAALDKHGVHGSVDTFTAAYDGDDAALAARAYDLAALRSLHEQFLHRFSPWRAQHVEQLLPLEQLARRVELVHEWRRTLFLDPGLPTELVPDDWLGADAVALFAQLYAELEAPAWDAWRTLQLAQDPEGDPPPVPTSTLLHGGNDV